MPRVTDILSMKDCSCKNQEKSKNQKFNREEQEETTETCRYPGSCHWDCWDNWTVLNKCPVRRLISTLVGPEGLWIPGRWILIKYKERKMFNRYLSFGVLLYTESHINTRQLHRPTETEVIFLLKSSKEIVNIVLF